MLRSTFKHAQSIRNIATLNAVTNAKRCFSVTQVPRASVDADQSHDDFKPKSKVDNVTDRFEKMKEFIDQQVNKEPVVLFMKGIPSRPECGFSRNVVNILESYKINYKTFDMNADQLMKEALKDYSDWPTIPQLYVKGEFQGGSDIVSKLHFDGKLKQILNDAKK
ncbi:monothiol glutaredoxin-S15, mitochondrial [Acrasis kona]|uniref:Monothiol glutaredoxin-S15, mitochondrial n=1 Tax=Acrasis kona TaxID=1008807 RepID=A0AAW2YK70_9EUKA